jgi:hypothetical protein
MRLIHEMPCTANYHTLYSPRRLVQCIPEHKATRGAPYIQKSRSNLQGKSILLDKQYKEFQVRGFLRTCLRKRCNKDYKLDPEHTYYWNLGKGAYSHTRRSSAQDNPS